MTRFVRYVGFLCSAIMWRRQFKNSAATIADMIRKKRANMFIAGVGFFFLFRKGVWVFAVCFLCGCFGCYHN